MQKYEYECRTNGGNPPVSNEFKFIRFDGVLGPDRSPWPRLPESGRLILSLADTSDKVQEEEAVQKANRKLNVFTASPAMRYLTI